MTKIPKTAFTAHVVETKQSKTGHQRALLKAKGGYFTVKQRSTKGPKLHKGQNIIYDPSIGKWYDLTTIEQKIRTQKPKKWRH